MIIYNFRVLWSRAGALLTGTCPFGATTRPGTRSSIDWRMTRTTLTSWSTLIIITAIKVTSCFMFAPIIWNCPRHQISWPSLKSGSLLVSPDTRLPASAPAQVKPGANLFCWFDEMQESNSGDFHETRNAMSTQLKTWFWWNIIFCLFKNLTVWVYDISSMFCLPFSGAVGSNFIKNCFKRNCKILHTFWLYLLIECFQLLTTTRTLSTNNQN